ncbi:hypothetical protein C8R46DRAFT_1050063 [Mycena filopes]|nr:hypothetical protein C8R46DRAFT_1050063 [Mycena filopes]
MDEIDQDLALTPDDRTNKDFALQMRKAAALSRLQYLNEQEAAVDETASRRPSPDAGSAAKRSRVNEQGDASPPRAPPSSAPGRALRPRDESGRVTSPGSAHGTAATYAETVANAYRCRAAPILLAAAPLSLAAASHALAAAPQPLAAAPQPLVAPPQPPAAGAQHAAGPLANVHAPLQQQQGAAAPYQFPPAFPHYLAQGNAVVANTTYDGNPAGLYCTATPIGGWHRTTGATKKNTEVAAVENGMIEVWDDSETVNGPGVYAHKVGGSAEQTDSGILKRFLNDVFNLQGSGITPSVGRAQAADPTDTLFFINDLPPYLTMALLAKGCVSADGHAFIFSPRIPSGPLYLGNVENLEFDDSDYGRQEATRVIRNGLEGATGTPFIQSLLRRRDALPAHVPPEQARAALLDSIQVHPMAITKDATVHFAFRVYMETPTHNADGVKEIFDAFQLLRFRSFESLGTPHEGYYCRMCRSIDHPTGLCPYGLAPGWLGPTIATVTAFYATYNNRGRGRGRGGSGGRARGTGGGGRAFGGRARGGGRARRARGN